MPHAPFARHGLPMAVAALLLACDPGGSAALTAGAFPTLDARGADAGGTWRGDAGGGSGSAALPDGEGSGAPEPPPILDQDQDGVPDSEDNCPETENAAQCDSDGDGDGDLCAAPLGTPEDPFIIPTCPVVADYETAGDTCDALSDTINVYPPATQAQGGPELVYLLVLEDLTEVTARIEAPEPEGVDVDVHILASLDPLILLDRGHHEASGTLEPGTYYIVLDTFGSTDSLCGSYALSVELNVIEPGTVEAPVTPGADADTPLPLPFWYEDHRDTSEATSQAFDAYPPSTVDQSGPEYVYTFTVDAEVRLAAVLRTPEPDGVDVDVHLLDAGYSLIERDNRGLYAVLAPGTYHLVVDTWAGDAQAGPYHLSLSIRPRGGDQSPYFNAMVLAAVDYLYADYGLLGYDGAVLTHDMDYWGKGTIPATMGTMTMCVAAMMEVILQAMILHAEDTGDASCFDYLPVGSWKSLASSNIKAHIWVNHDLGTWGTADALINFEMGETVPFEELRPGAFINLNRNNGTGHAVVFIAFIDAYGNTYSAHNKAVVGFKYFSAQGGGVGTGGLDYRYAVFSAHGSPEMPYKRDTGVMYSTNQHYLNTGEMFLPAYWGDADALPTWEGEADSAFDKATFTGETIDDHADYRAQPPRRTAPSPLKDLQRGLDGREQPAP